MTFVGDGSIKHYDKLKNIFINSKFAKENLNNCNATSLGIAGYNKYIKGITQSSDDLIPLYLRKSSAERMLEKGNKS